MSCKLFAGIIISSLDGLLQLNADAVLFRAPGVAMALFLLKKHMREQCWSSSNILRVSKKREMFYSVKTLPSGIFLLFPAMASFKTFFWSRTINNAPELQQSCSRWNPFPAEECRRIGWQLLEEHNKMDSTELWNLESIHSSINQVAYYRMQASSVSVKICWLWWMISSACWTICSNRQRGASLSCRRLRPEAAWQPAVLRK